MKVISSPNIDPVRGQIWEVFLDPTEGMEMQKTRPCVILTAEPFRRVQLRMVVPITGWQDHFGRADWAVRLEPTATNGLEKPSAALAIQVRSVALERFYDDDAKAYLRGQVSAEELEAIVLAVGLIFEHP